MIPLVGSSAVSLIRFFETFHRNDKTERGISKYQVRFFLQWRRAWDSNPRGLLSLTRFPGELLSHSVNSPCPIKTYLFNCAWLVYNTFFQNASRIKGKGIFWCEAGRTYQRNAITCFLQASLWRLKARGNDLKFPPLKPKRLWSGGFLLQRPLRYCSFLNGIVLHGLHRRKFPCSPRYVRSMFFMLRSIVSSLL